MVSNDRDSRVNAATSKVNQAVAEGKVTAETSQNLMRWLTEPQYAPFQSALIELIESGRCDELNRLFWERIPFGTGGRRGPMSDFGSATINDRTIAESAHGLAEYVLRYRAQNGIKSPPRAVIAFDSRRRSPEFAKRTASVLVAHGFHVYFFPEARSTPELSFAVRHLECATGVMISASHNPPSDNGFKAYWSNGGQILPPHDAGIIECVDAATVIPSVDFDAAVSNGQITAIGESVDAAYTQSVVSLSLSPARGISALYTPLHGVGETSVYRVVREAGFRDVSIFELQRSQDGSFPNVPDQLPNPERAAVFGPAINEAARMGVDLVLASDPDADRMAVAVRDEWTGQFVCLTGNQLGALLTDYVLSRRAAAGTLSSDHYIIETLVTTPMIAAIGKSYGVQVIRDVLVGFKYIAGEIEARRADQFVFAAEESIGFMAGNYCRDKDAAVGALFVLELAAELKLRGQTLLEHLNELYGRHGYYREETISTMCPGQTGQARIRQIMAAFRNGPPAELGGCVLETVRDFKLHEVRSLPDNRRVEAIPSPSGDLLTFAGRGHGCQITVAMRPSGTEPKIKFYYFVHADVSGDLDQASNRTATCLEQLKAAMQAWMDEVPDA